MKPQVSIGSARAGKCWAYANLDRPSIPDRSVCTKPLPNKLGIECGGWCEKDERQWCQRPVGGRNGGHGRENSRRFRAGWRVNSARYTHRVAISNHRIVDVTDAQVTFRWKDYAHHKRRSMTLTHEEFLRRFLQHILPRGFLRIRHFGLFANRRRGALLPLCCTLLAIQPPPVVTKLAVSPILWFCPCCRGPMRVVERLSANELRREQSRPVERLDSS